MNAMRPRLNSGGAAGRDLAKILREKDQYPESGYILGRDGCRRDAVSNESDLYRRCHACQRRIRAAPHLSTVYDGRRYKSQEQQKYRKTSFGCDLNIGVMSDISAPGDLKQFAIIVRREIPELPESDSC